MEDTPMDPCCARAATRMSSEDRRQAILDAAAAVFTEKGFERTSLSEIIARSGGSRSTVYEQFGDKEGLFTEVLRDRTNAYLGSIETTLREDWPPEKALYETGLSYLLKILSPEGQAIYRMVISEGRRFPIVVDLFFELGVFRLRARIARYLDRLVETGLKHFDDTEVAARMFLAFIAGDAPLLAAADEASQPTPDEVRRHTRLAVDVFLGGFAAVGHDRAMPADA